MYAFRDEVRAHRVTPDDSGSTLVTCYQLSNDTLMAEQEFKAINGQEGGYDWMGFNGGQLRETVKTSYFPHFNQTGLNDELPWQLLSAQGKKNTL